METRLSMDSIPDFPSDNPMDEDSFISNDMQEVGRGQGIGNSEFLNDTSKSEER